MDANQAGGVESGNDLDDSHEVTTFVHQFYEQVSRDDLLGPVFNEVAQVNWAEHMPKLAAFWCRVLFGTAGYTGNPFAAHRRIHDMKPFTVAHFERWLALFHDTLDRNWSGPNVDKMKDIAGNVARVHSNQLIAQPISTTPPERSNMNQIHPSMTLGEIVTLHPSLAADLERRGLDYCCHGARTLHAAADEVGLNPQLVADELSAIRGDEPPATWASLDPVDLIDHIESVHHRYLWSELPRITTLVDKIVTVHGARHHELNAVQRLFAELRADFEPHLVDEEQVLFPMIRRIAAAADESASDIEHLVEQIELRSVEHETVGALLEELHLITDGYVTPADGCASYAACYLALANLQTDTHLHVHKENNVLFPAVRATGFLSERHVMSQA